MRLSRLTLPFRSACLLFAAQGALSAALAQDAPLIQPGAPGQDAKALSADEAVKVADSSYSAADVLFMQQMIPHHFQATQMADLVEGRTAREVIVEIAGKIKSSQADEIEFMQSWLTERGEDAPDPAAHAAMGHDMDHSMHHGDGMSMQDIGMASPAEMATLAESEGVGFDRLFLTLMINHHEGAIRMVDDLLDQGGSAYDPALYDFANDIKNDQRAEIRKMDALLGELQEDPRTGLEPGYLDAGSAISNLQLVASLPRPRGFIDPENPIGLPPILEPEEDEDGRGDDSEDQKTVWGERFPSLSFWNTDMAFQDDILVAGNYHGFNIYRLGEEDAPELVSSIVCPGGQGDVSIVGDLLIMSVEQTRGRVDCGLQGIQEDVSDERFRGLRIFDISDLEAPRQVGQVQTCRGSHTHSVVSANRRRIVVYNSGTSSVRSDEELAGCKYGQPGDEDTALFSIDVIEIPVSDPSRARITSSPRVFADTKSGRAAGLWEGGDHGTGTQSTRRTDQCHDITIFPSLKLAAGACSGNGIILDISNPMKPKRIDDVTDPGFAYWHSATFNNDGTKVLFTDEWGGGTRPRCKASDPATWGADAIYDIVDGKLEFRSYYKIAAPQTEEENCVAHNGSVVPVPGRDIFLQAWYQGGLSIVDFTDSAKPLEIAYFDRGPIHPERMVVGGYWSTYFYDGKIYGTEIIRGLDVLELTPSEHLTENEIAAAKLAQMDGVFNPQQQFPVTWPAEPVVAKAYVDQLVRSGDMDEDAMASMSAVLDQASARLSQGEKDRELANTIGDVASEISDAEADGQAAKRMAALSDTLDGIAKRLR